MYVHACTHRDICMWTHTERHMNAHARTHRHVCTCTLTQRHVHVDTHRGTHAPQPIKYKIGKCNIQAKDQ